MNSKTKSVIGTVLGITSSALFPLTFWLTARESRKTNQKIDELSKDAKTADKIKVYLKGYSPAIISAVCGMASAISGAIISRKANIALGASLATAYAIINENKAKLKQVLGSDKAKEVEAKIKKEIGIDEAKKTEVKDLPEGTKLYYNEYIGFFTAKPEDIEVARRTMNERLNVLDVDGVAHEKRKGHKFSYSFYTTIEDFLVDAKAKTVKGVRKDSNFADTGWSAEGNEEQYGYSWIHTSLIDGKTAFCNGEPKPYTQIIFEEEPYCIPDQYVLADSDAYDQVFQNKIIGENHEDELPKFGEFADEVDPDFDGKATDFDKR